MTIHQTEVRARRLPGKPGQAYDLSGEELDFTNIYEQAAQVSTIKVDTAVDTTDYTFSVNGSEVKITSGAGATKKAIADALADEANNTLAVRAAVTAVSDGVDKVTITALQPGVAFLLATSDTNLTAASVTAPASADEIPFGRLVVYGGASGLDVYPNRLGRLPVAGDSGNINSITLGVSLFKYDNEGTAYEPNARCAAMKVGRVWVECSEAVSRTDSVYVGTTSDEVGKFFKSSGGGRLQLTSGAKWFLSRAADGLAVLECSF